MEIGWIDIGLNGYSFRIDEKDVHPTFAIRVGPYERTQTSFCASKILSYEKYLQGLFQLVVEEHLLFSP